VTLKEYWEQLNAHDWYYEMSDDHRVWKAGFREQTRLEELAKQSKEHAALFNAFAAHYNFHKPDDQRPSLPECPQ
jgi:ribonucleotide reductase alpha subunit